MWTYNYSFEQSAVRSDQESFLSHGKEWTKHKYIKKAKRPSYVRYYYGKDDAPEVSPDMFGMSMGYSTGEYQKDQQDLQYERDHAAGRDNRTWEQYFSDKMRAYKNSSQYKEDEQAYLERRYGNDKNKRNETRNVPSLYTKEEEAQLEEQSSQREQEEKEERRRRLIQAGKSALNYYF